MAHETMDRWLRVFERMYYAFRISPFGAPKIRAVKKEQELYLWARTAVSDEGARFENLVACQLLKYCHFMEDSEGYRMDLRFLRDTDKREVDFVVLKEGRPLFAVECKTGEKDISPALFYFKERVRLTSSRRAPRTMRGSRGLSPLSNIWPAFQEARMKAPAGGIA